jgi:hypothetical protein
MTLQNLQQRARALWPALKGSLALVRKPCTRPHCRACAGGQKHPAYILSFTQAGKRHCLYVPKSLVPALRQYLKNGRQLEQLLYSVGPLILRSTRKKKAVPSPKNKSKS